MHDQHHPCSPRCGGNVFVAVIIPQMVKSIGYDFTAGLLKAENVAIACHLPPYLVNSLSLVSPDTPTLSGNPQRYKGGNGGSFILS